MSCWAQLRCVTLLYVDAVTSLQNLHYSTFYDLVGLVRTVQQIMTGLRLSETEDAKVFEASVICYSYK
jgi:hypothetical protein